VNRLVIFGAGGHAKVVADAAACQGCWSEIVFLDDRWPALAKSGAWPIVGTITDYTTHISHSDTIVVAIGNAIVRLALLRQCVVMGYKLATIIHPSAVVSQYAKIGAGVVVFANAVVNIDAVLGLGCIVNTNAVVEHDVVLGEGVHICPGASVAGGVTIGDQTWVGIGSCVRQGLSIGSEVIIGAGAAVVSNISDKQTVVGVPAKLKS
jgi:sugar O-acyltransferase (sialic acid O-acetyltransferase NeuD family)